MTTNIFNRPLELALRAMLVATCAKPGTRFSAERLAYLDFVATYGKIFNVAERNLHGDNTFCFAELLNRVVLMRKALAQAAAQSYFDFVPSESSGFLFSLSAKGREFCSSLNNDYVERYVDAARRALQQYENFDDFELAQTVREQASRF
jgi:hypothetical protein